MRGSQVPLLKLRYCFLNEVGQDWLYVDELDDTGCEKLSGSTTGTGSKNNGVSIVEAGH